MVKVWKRPDVSSNELDVVVGAGGWVFKTDTHSARISSECVCACLTFPRVLRARRGHNLLRACRRLIPIVIDRITPTTSRAASTTARTFSASERSPNTMRITIAIIRAMALDACPNTTGSQTCKFSHLLVNEPYVNKGISRIGKTLETVASCGKMIDRRSGGWAVGRRKANSLAIVNAW